MLQVDGQRHVRERRPLHLRPRAHELRPMPRPDSAGELHIRSLSNISWELLTLFGVLAVVIVTLSTLAHDVV